ncbi:MAG: type II toxin-antitoxin system YafQ family toxin [Candidatus Sulfotelmatobacter sp.]|jgi:mRNA interferase YafQ
MRRIELTSVFRRDFKREKRGQHRRDIDSLVSDVVSLFAEDRPLSDKHRDHSLSGQWDDHRECHLKPDLLLVYRKPDALVLQLVRIANSWLATMFRPIKPQRICKIASSNMIK